MSRIREHHEKLNEDGIGKCSVPMWSCGLPGGFCDEAAYGKRPEGVTHTRWDNYSYREDGLYSGYVPALACPMHGGPKTRVFMDGNQFCAVYPDFINLQESPAGFGDTAEDARNAIAKEKP